MGSASIVNTMSVVSVAASPARVRESTDSGAVVSPEEKSSPMSCGMFAISATVHASDAANPVSPTDTQVTALALAHAQIAHLEEYPWETVIPICCHRFPSLSVTFTAGQYGGGLGGSVRDRFAFVVSHPMNATRKRPVLGGHRGRAHPEPGSIGPGDLLEEERVTVDRPGRRTGRRRRTDRRGFRCARRRSGSRRRSGGRGGRFPRSGWLCRRA